MLQACKRTSQHEFAIWQPAWPTVRVECQYQQISPGCPAQDGAVRARARCGGFIPLREMTSLMVVIWSGYELEVVDAFCAGAEGA